MKWQALSLAMLASAGIATPIAAIPKTDIYTLRVSSKYAQDIDGATLTLRSSQIGVFPGSPAVQFYTVPSPDGRVELHRYPVSDSEQVLAFVGKQGLLDFAVTEPTTSPDEPGTTCDWKSFGLGTQSEGKPENLVTYAGGKGGSWVAFPGKDGWTINWRSADAITIDTYMVVDVVYEPASGEGGPNYGSS